MSHQPNLFPPDTPSGSGLPGPEQSETGPPRVPPWLRRLELLIYVIVRIYVGVIVLVLPWTPLWTGNHLLNYFPSMSSFLSYGAVRGIISGLGLLNIWIAVDDAIHYRGSGSWRV